MFICQSKPSSEISWQQFCLFQRVNLMKKTIIYVFIPLNTKRLVRMVLLEVPDDVEEADVGADDAGEEADDKDEGVLQRAEDELRASVRVPVDGGVNLSISFEGQW